MAVFAKAFEINLSKLLDIDTINTFEKYETKVQNNVK
jgi:hypothetical protein